MMEGSSVEKRISTNGGTRVTRRKLQTPGIAKICKDRKHGGTRACGLGRACVTMQLQKSEREKPHSGKTKSQSPTKTPCNQPAIAILTHTIFCKYACMGSQDDPDAPR